MSDQGKACPVHEAIDLLQTKWTLHVIRSLLEGPAGFNELSRAAGGCNPTTLTQRLDHLCRIGLVEKTVISALPPKTSYALTPEGARLEQVIGAIEGWARERDSAAPVAQPSTAA
jgi:DNA-binding HxlR family transcriptional regulator